MKEGTVHKASARRDLEELIQTCDAIENRRFNPFLLDVGEALRILRRHYKGWHSLSDHLLDMKALTGLARVVGLQSAHLRFQSSSLFVDPTMVKQKVEGSSREQLAEFLLLSWHPIVEMEQLTLSTAKEAMGYWERMLPFFERWKRLQAGPLTMPVATGLGELHNTGLVPDKAFSLRLQEFWRELKEKVGTGGRIGYWAFITGSSFGETVSRAQYVSFLVTYGFASLEKKRRELFLVPREEPLPRREGSPLSFPISIPREVPS